MAPRVVTAAVLLAVVVLCQCAATVRAQSPVYIKNYGTADTTCASAPRSIFSGFAASCAAGTCTSASTGPKTTTCPSGSALQVPTVAAGWGVYGSSVTYDTATCTGAPVAYSVAQSGTPSASTCFYVYTDSTSSADVYAQVNCASSPATGKVCFGDPTCSSGAACTSFNTSVSCNPIAQATGFYTSLSCISSGVQTLPSLLAAVVAATVAIASFGLAF
jgi:hypothetical protein